VGKATMAGLDLDVFELLDADSSAAQQIIEHGLTRWN